MGCGRHGVTVAATVVSCMCIGRKLQPRGDSLNNTIALPWQPIPPKGALSGLIYFAYLFVKLPPIPADGFAEGFTHAADISILALNSDWFLLFMREILARTAAFEGDSIRSNIFVGCLKLRLAVIPHCTPLPGLLTDGDMLIMGNYGRFFSFIQKQCSKLELLHFWCVCFLCFYFYQYKK